MTRRIASIAGIFIFIAVVFLFFIFGGRIRTALLPEVNFISPEYVIINGEYCYSLPESCLHYDTDGEYIITAKPNEKYEDGIYNASRTKINYEITGNILIVKNGVDSGSIVISDNIGVGEMCVLRLCRPSI